MRLSRVRIGTRLAAAFCLLAVLLTLVAGAGLFSALHLEDDLEAVGEVNARKLVLNYEMAESVHVVGRVVRTMILLDDPAVIEQEMAKVQAARDAYDAAWRELQTYPTSPDAAAVREAVEAGRIAARALNDRLITLAREQRDDEARELLITQGIALNQAWLDAVDASVRYQVDTNARRLEEGRASFRQGLKAGGAITVIALVLAITAAWVITTSVTRPIHYVTACARRMADGDLSQRVERRVNWDGRDETSQLIAAMQAMHDSLCETVGSVHRNATNVATAAARIATGSGDLSSRTEQQAANLQQTAATMDQLTATVRSNTDHTVRATELVETVGSVARDGGGMMEKVVAQMAGIEDSSRRIADIIGVIDGIAFQTNILALNAAVEAARAGEHGRGFAVVAAEVRALAQRTSVSAREIKDLIGRSVDQVTHGTELVGRTQRTMSGLLESIGRVTVLMQEVRTATCEQSDGIAQVGQAVVQLDSLTQQNAALVDESAASAGSLSRQAEELVTSVSRFRLATP